MIRVPPLKYTIFNCEEEDEESMTYWKKDLAADFLNDVVDRQFIHSLLLCHLSKQFLLPASCSADYNLYVYIELTEFGSLLIIPYVIWGYVFFNKNKRIADPSMLLLRPRQTHIQLHNWETTTTICFCFLKKGMRFGHFSYHQSIALPNQMANLMNDDFLI